MRPDKSGPKNATCHTKILFNNAKYFVLTFVTKKSNKRSRWYRVSGSVFRSVQNSQTDIIKVSNTPARRGVSDSTKDSPDCAPWLLSGVRLLDEKQSKRQPSPANPVRSNICCYCFSLVMKYKSNRTLHFFM